MNTPGENRGEEELLAPSANVTVRTAATLTSKANVRELPEKSCFQMQYVAAEIIRANRHLYLDQVAFLFHRRVVESGPRYIYRTLSDIATSFEFSEFRPSA